jgi:hypothetical protein
VRQPHTCRSSKLKGVHIQNIVRYLGHRLVGIVRANSNTSVSSIIETIFGFTSYRVKYSKGWQAKQHSIELLWDDWKEVSNQVPRILGDMKHFNPGLRWFPYAGRIVTTWIAFQSMLSREFIGLSLSRWRHSSIASLSTC